MRLLQRIAKNRRASLRSHSASRLKRERLAETESSFVGPQRKAWSVVRDHIFREQPKTQLTTVTLPWGRGVGKSHWDRQVACAITARWDGVLRKGALRPFRGVRIAWYMDTKLHWKDIHAAPLVAELEGDGFWACLGAKIDRSTWTITFPGGSIWKVFPSAPAQAKAGRGFRPDVSIGDEIDDTDRAVYESVAIPWFTEQWSFKLRIQSGTPRRGRRGLLYHLHKLGISQAPEHANYHSFHATYKDVPEIVDPDVALDAYRNRVSDAVYAREWQCDFSTGEGLVYDTWDPALHIKPLDGLPFSKIILGKDWGYNHPGSLGVYGVRGYGRDATVVRFDEVYERERPPTWWLERIRQRAQGARVVYCDPSQPGRIHDLQAAGIPALPANNSVEEGIGTCADLLFPRPDPEEPDNDRKRTPRFTVTPNCKAFLSEIDIYRRKPHPILPDEYTEEPIKVHDDAMDDWRYAMHSEFGDAPSPRVVHAY